MLAHVVALFLTASLFFLVDGFLSRDTRYLLILHHTHPGEPTLYKLMGALGTYEGSFLFFTFLLGLYGAVYAWVERASLAEEALKIHLFIVGLFSLFLLTVAHPFTLTPPGAGTGAFNPLLEDPAMSFHPPLLYLGYTGFSLIFSLTLAHIRHNSFEDWVRHTRRWLLLAWALLTLGVVSGSWWAYYQLGWGGFWSWDPTENAALIPWLLSATLIHFLPIVAKTGRYLRTALLLALSCFISTLAGTFLVRSGLLFSIHTFGTDQARGVALFLLFYSISVLGLSLYLWRFSTLHRQVGQEKNFVLLSQEGILLVACTLFLTCFFSIALGTVYPIFLYKLGFGLVSVGAPFFHLTCLPFAAILAALLPFGLFLKDIVRKFFLGALCACFIALFPILFCSGGVFIASLGFFLSSWVILGSLFHIALQRNKRRLIGRTLAHIGFGILILGLTIVDGWKQEAFFSVKVGQKFLFHNAQFYLRSVQEVKGPDYRALTAVIALKNLQKERVEVVFKPQIRYFAQSGQVTFYSSLVTSWLSQMYMVLSLGDEPETFLCRVYYQPFILCIWIGGVCMALGALFSFFQAPVAQRPRRQK